MIYIKITGGTEAVLLEAHADPQYVHLQSNGLVVRCNELYADGILSLDGSQIYQFSGKQILPETSLVATIISMSEYWSLLDSQVAPEEDDDLEDPSDSDGSEAGDDVSTTMTKSEIVNKLLSIEDELRATKILLGVE